MKAIEKVIDGLVESTKNQHEITKARHEISKKSPAQAKADFKERHEYAKKPHAEKQRLELERLQNQKKY